MRYTGLIVLFAVAPRLLPAQGVLVAPHVIYMDHRTRSGQITLYNPGNESVEVAISTFFGYPVTDSAGDFQLRTVDQPDSTQPSAARWLQAFPRRMTLGPQERQTVRLLGRPPAFLPDGEYWARLVVAAKGGTVPVSGVGDTTAIQVGLTLEVRTVLPVLYRKGKPSTGVVLSHLRARIVGDSLEVRAHLLRQGNAAFIGTVQGALVDSAGKVITTFKSPQAVYYDTDPRLTAPLLGMHSGQYRLRFEVSSEREDVPSEAILPILPVRDSVVVSLP